MSPARRESRRGWLPALMTVAGVVLAATPALRKQIQVAMNKLRKDLPPITDMVRVNL